ncbi:type VI secretion system Vgr family protein [Type-D symbiont of Plautia stali]|uniref:type VI secretion system Vgr family protein n=1 Tax=Type-D symbiont of Plautia stali TaxID=1560356 RepID=UPI00073E34EA|nr:type VI secretion system Vgr family protein [Type-D symbiont of Plautia stali]
METWSELFPRQNPYRLDIHNCALQPDVLKFYGREALSEPFRWDIEFTCAQAMAMQDVLMEFASFSMRSGKRVYGVITGFDWLATTVDQSHYRIRLESRLALLSRTRRSRVFQNLSVPELAEQLLREHGYEGPEFEFRLTQPLPTRELITQWRESDLDFLRRILAETGIWFRSEMNSATETETLIFSDSQQGYTEGVTLLCRELSGLHDAGREAVWGLRSWHDVVTGGVAVKDYNYRQAAEPGEAKAAVRSHAITTGEHYRYAEPFAMAGDDATAEPESGAFFARLHHERSLNHAARLHLFSNSDALSPGQLLNVSDDSSGELADGMVIRLATFHGARDRKLQVSLWGIPYSEQYVMRPAPLSRPVISGTLPARVESRHGDDIYAWLDAQGRYRVKLDMDRDISESGYSYLWLRQAKPYAGDTHGWHTPLVQGTEVAIAFDGGDPDRPYIAHALHDSEHPDIVSRDNRSQNILRTPARNELRMEDKRGSEHVVLSTEYGKTQLNQGHITDAQGKQRGAGFELRTDEHGVIRVAKGLFVTADGQQKAVGEVLEMDAALREIELCLELMKQLDTAMQQAQALRADLSAQLAMFNERLKPLNELVHFAAPEGMAFASGEHLLMAATENVAINAGGDISAGAMEDVSLMAGESAGLFARSGRLSLIASKGPLVMQAQNAAMQLLSEKKLSMSAEQDVLFAAKKRITLIGGGSYLKIEAGKIEYGTVGRYIGKVKAVMKGGIQSEQPELTRVQPVMSQEVCFPCLLNAIRANDAVVQGVG